jgi:hypothetical protein
MAKSRMVKTKFWSDAYIKSLSKDERYFFIYLLTNAYTEISGLYEITTKAMAFDTDLSEGIIRGALDKFAKDGKVFYFNSQYMFIVNFSRHQQKNPNVKKGIQRSLNEMSPHLLNEMRKAIKDFDSLLYLNFNENLNSDPNLDSSPNGDLNENLNSNENFNKSKQDLIDKPNSPSEFKYGDYKSKEALDALFRNKNSDGNKR